MKKYHGEWHKEKKVLFPGYVFLVSGDKDRLFLELKKVTGLTKLLGTGQEVVPLTLPEIEFLQRFGKEDQIVEMSRGIIENDKVIITSGPLKGNEALIKKIDRHKRRLIWRLKCLDEGRDTGGSGDCKEEGMRRIGLCHTDSN